MIKVNLSTEEAHLGSQFKHFLNKEPSKFFNEYLAVMFNKTFTVFLLPELFPSTFTN